MVVIHLTMDLGRLEWRFERDSISGGGGAQILECQGNHYNASRFSLLLWPSWHTNGTWKLQPAMYGDSGHKMDSKGMFRGYLEGWGWRAKQHIALPLHLPRQDSVQFTFYQLVSIITLFFVNFGTAVISTIITAFGARET